LVIMEGEIEGPGQDGDPVRQERTKTRGEAKGKTGRRARGGGRGWVGRRGGGKRASKKATGTQAGRTIPNRAPGGGNADLGRGKTETLQEGGWHHQGGRRKEKREEAARAAGRRGVGRE